MARYLLKNVSPSCYFIHASRARIGRVTLHDGKWVGIIGGLKVYGSTAQDAFQQVCRAQNRVNLCGENDSAKANAEVARRNAEVRRQIADINNAEGFDVLRVRNRRVNI